jgi:hypothetical protein
VFLAEKQDVSEHLKSSESAMQQVAHRAVGEAPILRDDVRIPLVHVVDGHDAFAGEVDGDVAAGFVKSCPV